MAKFLETPDVKRLLQKAVTAAGSQSAWARKVGVQPALVNFVLNGRRAPSKSILAALGLKIVYIKKSSRR
jgi:hypothetical protein